ncbi:MAG TPA: hypothetical protein VG319_00830 [Polyangia bacterium]|jgi:hypothetical protein|nr:hypothetical protein [Polyangia bacterium]
MARVGMVLVFVAGVSLVSAGARASCVVTNDTAYEFVVASGNAPNQKVAAHATTTIEAGKIAGKSPEGRTISGSCKDGARMVVREKNGVPLLLPMPTPKKK